MPTSSLVHLPQSRSAEEFESMCVDVLDILYDTYFEIYGRSGQKQNGIDLYAPSTGPNYTVAQCKNYYNCSHEKLRSQLKKDIKSTQNLGFSIGLFIVMTSLSRDILTQNDILKLKCKSQIRILFWDDIQKILYENKELLKKYYPDFQENHSIPIEDKNKLIVNVLKLKQLAEILANDYSNYKIACNIEDDKNLYNVCVCMMEAMQCLESIMSIWYIQLEKGRITKPISKLQKNMPSFHNEDQFGFGAEMIETIDNFTKYFCDTNKNIEFIKNCNKIIKRTKKLD